MVSEEAFAESLGEIGDRRIVMVEHLDEHRRTGEAPALSDGGGGAMPAFICYTSGTTGDPKGAILTHELWNAGSQGWAQAMAIGPSDRVLLPFPLAFTGGLAVWLFTYCIILYFSDKSRIGLKNISVYCMKAKSTPMVSVP